jgi:3-deoxy-D-manno-octulosonate 8-phosphate phosphatase (KDO 8-P phosphatase)
MIEGALARGIKLVGFDVDGVLTDGGIYLGHGGGTVVTHGSGPMETKRYDIQDGLGIHLLQRAGIRTAIVTGRVSESVRLRAAELGIDDVIQDAGAMKLPGFLSILSRYRIDPKDAAFLGDDFPDAPILKMVGLPVAVGNAVPEIRAMCRVQLTKTGGHGAVREFVEMLLKAQGHWSRVCDEYVAERSITERAGHGPDY